VTGRILRACAGLALAFPLASAQAGVIRGVVHAAALAPAAGGAAAYSGMANSMPGMHAPVRGLASDAVVYVERVSAAADSAIGRTPARPQLAQQGQMFVPRVLAVAAGTAVDFPNLDPIYHNVFSLSPVKRFDLGKYSRGHFKTVVFDRCGLVNVFCDIHSDMEAFVLVLPHHAFVQPGADGRFALPELPAGHYVVKVWHPDRPESSHPVDLPETGGVDLEVSL
jgi:plastocyanin